MGKYLKSILGPFSGLVGTVVGASWKGISVMRSRSVKSNRPATENQMKQRTAFTLMTEFLNPIRDLINVGFQTYQKDLRLTTPRLRSILKRESPVFTLP
ncbi:DUF6266 family protein [Chitinophaga filiformis]|uniref:Uncharacterized protein n=1 Tax=Chitinophaga filiformis TaxID=104663 RepID=A0A1G7M154_CHIFI|nr:DUF6266 family protein [Chitinophaga filiformis]SDF55366.1 hypothetical protein SAMN04488121_102252 [Chitinophaga filiformis]